MSTEEHYLDTGAHTVGELTPDDLELERYLLDLSLQPIERFDGFSHIEQYLLSALRYQLNYTCYALAMAQYNYTPPSPATSPRHRPTPSRRCATNGCGVTGPTNVWWVISAGIPTRSNSPT